MDNELETFSGMAKESFGDQKLDISNQLNSAMSISPSSPSELQQKIIEVN